MKNDETETIEIRQDASAGSGVVRGIAWSLEYASIASRTGVMKPRNNPKPVYVARKLAIKRSGYFHLSLGHVHARQ